MSGRYLVSMPTTLSCDVLIIGAGVGGITLAHELTKNGIDTLILDEGPYIDNIYERDQRQNFSEVWRNGGLTVALGKPPIAYAEGCCVGGGSEINSGIFQETPANLLADWAVKYQIEHFSPELLQPFYQEAEHLIHADYQTLKSDSLILERAAKELNWSGKSLKCAYTQGKKQSLCATLLPKALQQGLRLIAQCKVKKLHLKKNSVSRVDAIGTDCQNKKHDVTIFSKHVFVCSGAIYTPHLLLKNGINRNIGKTLQLHPTIKVLCEFDEPISRDSAPVPTYAITEFMPDIRIGGSVMAKNFIAMSVAEDYERRKHLLDKLQYCGVYYAMIKPEGKGGIKNIPFTQDPLVNYKLTTKDWYTLFQGLDYLQQAMFAVGAKQVFPSVAKHVGWTHKASLVEIEKINKKETNLMTIHLFSSCPMGEDRTQCAVNSFGKLHGYENMYLSDASIIPEAMGTNPQGTIMALALRNARHFIEMRNSK